MVSSFQKELEKLGSDQADFCHEIKEILDAIEYLEDDIAQAARARDANRGQDFPSTIDLSEIKADLNVTKRAALEVLASGGCPAYKEYSS